MSAYDELFQRAAQVIRASELAPHSALIEALLLPGIEVKTEAAAPESLALGASKFGGLPDAPQDFSWPLFRDEPLSFIAQFNCQEIAPFDVQKMLPSSGTLAFFSALRPPGDIDDSRMHGDIGLMQATRGAWRVLHFDALQTLRPTALPNGHQSRIYESQAVSQLWNVVSAPDSEALELEALFRDEDGIVTDEWEAYFDLRDEIEDGNPTKAGSHSLLGWAYFRQHDERAQAERFVRGLEYDAELPKSESTALHQAATRWRLLLQLSSSDDMSWAGDGYGYFFLPFDSMKTRRFEDSFFGLQR